MPIWKIKDKEKGIFSLENPQNIGDIYFPLTNTQGKIFSWITPFLSGDIKTSIHSYLTKPTTIFDTKNPSCIRTLWLYFNKNDILNISSFWPTDDKISLEAGPLWHELTRKNKSHGLVIETTNFVPEGAAVEIMWIKITNKGKKLKEFTPISSIPLFCRAQENIIDHRHVTSLLNRAFVNSQGIMVKPTMCFDERGHKQNKLAYFVYGFSDRHRSLSGVFSSLDEFCGESGNLTFPQSVYLNKNPAKRKIVSGKENIGGLKFKKHSLKPLSSINIFLVMGVASDASAKKLYQKFNTPSKIYTALNKSKKSWSKVFNNFNLSTGNDLFDFWMRWVALQPTLRRIFGCSFIGHFDYGKGGRGWRDLWQDLLSQVIINPSKIKKTLIKNFEGVRIDASNATVITAQGEFISDRNKISRVWMDHGVWPYLTTKAYIDRTADLNILFEKVGFFKDHQLKRAKEIDESLLLSHDQHLLTDLRGKPYRSSILEHLLIQAVVSFFNIGKHGNVRLENADWNDALDMAAENGESVAFTCMYAANLKSLAELLETLKIQKDVRHLDLAKELTLLIDSPKIRINYSNINTRKKILEEYLEQTKHYVQGQTVKINIEDLICDLNRKADWLIEHVRRNEWLPGLGFFNGYYDNRSKPVEGKINNTIRLSLTSQVFPIMSGVADKIKTKKILKALNRYLKPKNASAFRLNTDFKDIKLDLGRAFAFSYGDKENGSIFSHMNVMLSYSLYTKGFVKEGYSVLKSLFDLSTHRKAQIYACMPEYFNLQYQGLYPYLTGSASWLIYLFITQSLGIGFTYGALKLEPKLLSEQFSKNNTLKANITFDNKKLTLILRNPGKKSWPNYFVKEARINGRKVNIADNTRTLTLNSPQIKRLLSKHTNTLEVLIG